MLLSELPELPDLQFETEGPGHAPGHDAFILARIVPLRPGLHVLDLGCGQGILALMLAAREAVHVVGLELRGDVLETARENMARNRGSLKGDIAWDEQDLRLFAPRTDERFDLVVMNPPYYREGEGRVPTDPARAAARHEQHGSLRDWIAAARRSLRPAGRVASIHPPERAGEAAELFSEHRFESVNRVEIRLDADPAAPAKWVVIECSLT